MHKILYSLFLLIAHSAVAQEKLLPGELNPFVRNGYEVLDWATEDLNGDKRKDYVLILRKQGEDTAGVESDIWEIHRPFLLITREKENKLKLVVENNSIIMCRYCGGVLGDPYNGITLKTGEIQLNFFGGSGFRWSVTLFFRFDPLKNNWLLQEENHWSYDAAQPELNERNERITRMETGGILLKDYTPDHHADTSHWLVQNKTFFYTSPELNSKPRKTYLVKGDRVQSWKSYKNFIACNFSNKNGADSFGYILKKDLQRLPAQKPKTIQ